MIGYLRKKDFFLIFKNLGIIMEGIGVVMLIPILVSFIYGENNYAGFLLSGILSISVGYVFRNKFFRQSKPKTQTWHDNSSICLAMGSFDG